MPNQHPDEWYFERGINPPDVEAYRRQVLREEAAALRPTREDEIRAALSMSPRVWGRPDLCRILAAPSFREAQALIHLPAVTVAPHTREFPES